MYQNLWLITNINYAQQRASYRGYDHADEITAAISVSFNNTGEKYVYVLHFVSFRVVVAVVVSIPLMSFMELIDIL